MTVQFFINGKPFSFSGHPMTRLLDVLRESAALTGTKEGCGEGECGACSVLVNDTLSNSCLIPIGELNGAKITTIEGIKNKKLQQAFLHSGGAQCGICTPGMVLAAHALLKRNKKPKKDEIRYALSGNICRCTGFDAIVKSVQEACR